MVMPTIYILIRFQRQKLFTSVAQGVEHAIKNSAEQVTNQSPSQLNFLKVK